MRNIVVVARDDGRGELYPFKFQHKNHVGEIFKIADYVFEVGEQNRVTIPAEIMNEFGFVRKDGKRAFVIVPHAVTVDGDIVPFGEIHHSKNIEMYLEDAPNGGQLPEEAFRPELMDEYERINPTDLEDYNLSW